MKQEKAIVLKHEEFQGGYRLLELSAPQVGPLVGPGQFLHLLIPRLNEAVLRRPFSIYQADESGVAVIYATVGKGTASMNFLKVGDEVDIIGPLGFGFPEPEEDRLPLLVAGGYGNAALYLQAKNSEQKGVAFFGGRSAIDILCVEEFKALGWEVCIATDDGSLGTKGFVTQALQNWLNENPAEPVEIFACGPNAMLKAVGDMFVATEHPCWLSMDRNMACGVGACLTCVIKLKDAETAEGWKWGRCCKDGPVFNAKEILWDE
jgi:dihydroorotate dehydrogenase electron transfer subunit